MRENHGGRVCEDRDLEHLAWLNDRGGQAADADERQTQNRIRGIQENQDHLLSIFQAEVLLEDRHDIRRCRDLEPVAERESRLADELGRVEREVAE